MPRRSDYASYDDFLAMQALVQRVWSPRARWHVGDVAWARFSTVASRSTWRTSLWSTGDRCVAWAWVELPGELGLVVEPGRPGLVADVLEWATSVMEPDEQSCTVLETEEDLIAGLVGAGFRPGADGPYFRHHAMSLDSLSDAAMPDGFRLRRVEDGEAVSRAAAHRAGWSDFGSVLSTETYAGVMSAWPYRADLDWVVEAPGGELVASALAWLDDVNRSGLLEPVSCAPAYRRLGLARAVNLAALHALRRAGATTAHVNPRGDDDYPVPGRLYRGIGFRPGPRTVAYTRSTARTDGSVSG